MLLLSYSNQQTNLFATGALYEGDWVSNKKHGQGAFVFENGRQFVGQIENDRFVSDSPVDTRGRVFVERANEQTSKRTNEQTNKRTNEQTNKRTNEQT